MPAQSSWRWAAAVAPVAAAPNVESLMKHPGALRQGDSATGGRSPSVALSPFRAATWIGRDRDQQARWTDPSLPAQTCLHVARGVALNPVVGQRRAGDVAAQLFQRFAVVRRATHCGVQAETLHVGAQAPAVSGMSLLAPSLTGRPALPACAASSCPSSSASWPCAPSSSGGAEPCRRACLCPGPCRPCRATRGDLTFPAGAVEVRRFDSGLQLRSEHGWIPECQLAWADSVLAVDLAPAQRENACHEHADHAAHDHGFAQSVVPAAHRRQQEH